MHSAMLTTKHTNTYNTEKLPTFRTTYSSMHYQGNVIQCISIKIDNIYKQCTLKISNENRVLVTSHFNFIGFTLFNKALQKFLH